VIHVAPVDGLEHGGFLELAVGHVLLMGMGRAYPF
jgi:hypothetical protein